MSRKYIKQINNDNFVYPNNFLAEYDVEIVHNLTESSVTGTVTNFVTTSVSSTSITFNYTSSFNLNGGEAYVNFNYIQSLYSVHCMLPNQLYFKPWRTVSYKKLAVVGSPYNTYTSSSNSFTITPSQFGLTTFSNGVYNFEFRMIGKRSVYPICQTITISSL